MSPARLARHRARSRDYKRRKRAAFVAAMDEINTMLDAYIKTGQHADAVDRIYRQHLAVVVK